MSLVNLAVRAARLFIDQMRTGQTIEGRILLPLGQKLIDIFEQKMIEGIVFSMESKLESHNSLGQYGLGKCTIYCNQHGADCRCVVWPAEAIGLSRDKIYDYVPGIHLRIKNDHIYQVFGFVEESLVYGNNLYDNPEVMGELSKEVTELINRMSDQPPVKQLIVEASNITRASDLKVDQQFSLKKGGTILTVVSIKSITKFAMQIEAQDKAKNKKIDLSSDTIVYLKE